MTTQLTHPQLGNITGIDAEKVHQYRGIKYASLDHQFAEPVLYTNGTQAALKATSFGPACIHSPTACSAEFTFIQHSLPLIEEFQYCGTECLNLNITTPKAIQMASLVPVFVFLHGGGFSIGANSWPQYDLSKLVEMSIERGSPVIGININYRLGIPGFLSSKELLAAGVKSNNGLRDQVIALTWIQKYISGFSGDPDNVTVVGESAGAVSCFLHLESQKPLFKRIFAMGGTPLLLKPIPTQVAEWVYSVVVKKLGLTGLSSEKKIEALRETTIEDLLAATSNLPLLPVIDGELITAPATFSRWSFQENHLPGTEWCESIMIGDCEMDSSILFYMLHDRLEGIEKAFIKSTEKSLPDSRTRQRLLNSYHIGDSNITSPDQKINNTLHFAHDIGFYAPLVTIASNWPKVVGKKSYVFHFNEPNPWPGRFQGVASHILDAAFLFQNYNEFLDEDQKGTARVFAEHFIDFVVGREPFPAYRAGEMGAMVYGNRDGNGERQRFVRSERREDHGRRNVVFEVAEGSSLEMLSLAWDGFMSGQ